MSTQVIAFEIFYTAHIDQNIGKPVVDKLIGLRVANGAYVAKANSRRCERKTTLHWKDGLSIFDNPEAAVAALKPLQGFSVTYDNRIISALVFESGDGRLKAVDEYGKSLRAAFKTKRAAAAHLVKELMKHKMDSLRSVKRFEKLIQKMRAVK